MSEVSPAVNRSSFRRFLTAAVISSAGSSVTAVAMPILVVQLLDATPFEVGMVNAAQLIPYAVLGLFAGVYVDRWRRKPILVWASVGRAVALGTVPLLWLAGLLHIWVLVIALLLFGSFSVFGFAAMQSLLPPAGSTQPTGESKRSTRPSRRSSNDIGANGRGRTRRPARRSRSDCRRRNQLSR